MISICSFGTRNPKFGGCGVYHRSIQVSETPDLVSRGIIEFSNGALGIIESAWLTLDAVGVFSNDSLQLIPDRGIARIELVDGGLSFWLEGGLLVPDTIGAPAYEVHLPKAVWRPSCRTFSLV